MFAAAFVALALAHTPTDADSGRGLQLVSALQQAAPPVAAQVPAETPADLGEVVVEGRRLQDMTRDFVNEVAAPARRRGLARWRDGVCVGVVNLQAEAATYIIDRVSTVAQDLGLRAGGPGCHPSVIISFATDANAFTEDFVSRRPQLFRVGGSGMDRGGAAFRRFVTNDHPVRWWIVSAPTDSETGDIATRIPGNCRAPCSGPMDYAPIIYVDAASRLNTQIVDDAKRAFIIVDVDKLNGVSLEQLADYLALVSLAQIDPDADTSAYLSILNIFDDPLQTTGLTQWDQAYLQGLYDAERRRRNSRANNTEIMNSIVRAHRDLTAEHAAIEEGAAEQP